MLRRVSLGLGILVLIGAALVLRERSEGKRWRFNHGHGYWSVHELVPMPRGFYERFGHYERFYDGPVDLGLVWDFSVAPGGRYAALAREGWLLLYDRQTGTIDTLVAGEPDERGFSWGTSAQTLRIRVAGGRDTIVHLGREP
jgi:hypothetical protein